MTYVTDQTSAELRAHMRSLKRMQGWHEPLADRLFKEVVEQDATIKKLEGALAAAEARNATLTDDAARYRYLRNDVLVDGEICEDLYVAVDQPAYPNSWALTGAKLDQAIDAARAAASISTKGDGHA